MAGAVAFIYWGRRGFSRFVLQAAHAARDIGLDACFSVSTANEIYPSFARLGSSVFPVDLFSTAAGALNAPRVFKIRRDLIDWLTAREVKSVIVLMSHVWTPLIAAAIKCCGIRYAVVVHDARPHPGDATGLIVKWLLNDVKAADTVVTLSESVRRELVRQCRIPAERIKTLFIPDMTYPPGAAVRARRRAEGQPLRILFFGRILRYKGLPLFVDAMRILTADQIPIEVSVCGEGDLGRQSSRLADLGAIVVNRWLTDEEVGHLLTSHDVVVLTHIEASQSGVIAAAMGAGVPVVTTPAGGLAEQVRSRRAGIVSERIDARAVADSIRALARDHSIYNAIADQIHAYRSFSVADFLGQLVDAAAPEHAVGRLADLRHEVPICLRNRIASAAAV